MTSDKSTPMFAFAQLLLRLVLVAAIVMVALKLFSGNTGLVHTYKLRQELAEISIATAVQRTHNKRLGYVLDSLRNDLDIIEYIARHDFRLIKENELLFEIQTIK